jgi:hypothetical protein
MSSRRVLTATAVFAAVLTLSAASIGASGGSRQISHPGLALSGNAAGLLPGQQARLTITVKTACGGSFWIGPGRRVRLTVSVRMRRDSPNSCQDKVFPLVFRGQASA